MHDIWLAIVALDKVFVYDIRQKNISEGQKITFYLKKPVFESSEM